MQWVLVLILFFDNVRIYFDQYEEDLMNNFLVRINTKFVMTFIVFLIFTISGFSAEIHDVVKKGDINKLKALITKDKLLVNLKDKNGKTPLHFACQNNNIEAIEYLFKNGANINEKNINGVTPLQYAAYMGHTGALEFLIKNKVDINSEDNTKRTALDFAILNKKIDIVDLLVKNGIKINLKQRGANFIHTVAVNGFKKLLKVIIKNGGDLNSLNVFGGTMLHSAVLGELPEIVKLMISKKINLNSIDKYGKTAFYYAENGENKEIIAIFNKAGIISKPEKKVILKKNYYGQKKPGAVPELFAPQLISRNGGHERDISFSNDGNLIYFSRSSRIMEVKRINGIWGDPKEAPFSSGYAESEAYFTPDNNRIYFISKRPKGDQKAPAPWDIWFTEKHDGVWGKAKLISPQFKGCFYTSFTKNWKMYYTGPDNNIYSSQYQNGKFEKSLKLGPNINTDKAEYNSFIAPDETYLIFTSFGWGKGSGNGDLFISFRDNKGNWIKPINMGPEINSKFHEYCPIVSPDGKYFFFTSNRLGNEDIYWVDSKVILDLKKKKIK